MEIRKTREDYFHFYLNTRTQLLLAQFQLFQSLSGIALAFLAIVFGTNTFQPSLWWILTSIFSLLLLLYSTTNVRETIDAQANDLDAGDLMLKNLQREIDAKANETREKENFDIYLDYLKKEQREEEKHSLYSGELANVMFFNILIFSFVALLDSHYQYNFNAFLSSIIAAICIIMSTILSFTDWNLEVVKRTSFFISKIQPYVRKPINTKHISY